MDDQEVIRLYTVERWTLRRIADLYHTNHHMIRRILHRNGVVITGNRQRKPASEETRRKISEANRGRKAWSTGLKMGEAFKRKNMRAKMRTSIDLNVYTDFERLKILTRLQAKWKQYLAPDDTTRQAFLDKFYFDRGFNAVYDAWIASNKNKWFYPSLDHKTPKVNGADWALDNLQFITWFENRAKADMTLDEWGTFKRATNTRSDLFIEVLLEDLDDRGN
jgi:hypothetical protein